MKTLFDKINPDVLKNIYDDQSKYPNLIKSLIETMKNEVAIGSLTLNDCMTIYGYAYNDSFSISKLYEIFNI